ncbi:DUF1566 domain-containing protein [Cognataquiflexum aquatile]|jgi:hypothetical protein|uniref:DUF1566 domain-containing protein n=1 Tax=Cognataquiflexum aquatile TaxID=2249427 RepID=UPI000DE831C6|nr:DUF1566 domain-containing protein [Cognataquiflexum aquatile]
MLKLKLLSPKSMVLILLSAVIIFSGCVKEESPEDVTIGEPYQGGVVAHIFEPGEEGYVEGKKTGIIIAPVEEVFLSQWGCQGRAVGGTSPEVGFGRSNTERVLAFHDALPNYYSNPTQCHPANNGTVAARVTIDFNLGGFNDWFMPSQEEMNYLYKNRDKIGGFSSVEYWSSCESNAANACVMSFVTGELLSKPKSEVLNVRVIRFF